MRNKTISSTIPALCRGGLLGRTALGGEIPKDVIDIGSRLEMFVDHFLVEKMDNVRLELNQPKDEGIAIKFDRPWEEGGSGYGVIARGFNSDSTNPAGGIPTGY